MKTPIIILLVILLGCAEDPAPAKIDVTFVAVCPYGCSVNIAIPDGDQPFTLYKGGQIEKTFSVQVGKSVQINATGDNPCMTGEVADCEANLPRGLSHIKFVSITIGGILAKFDRDAGGPDSRTITAEIEVFDPAKGFN